MSETYCSRRVQFSRVKPCAIFELGNLRHLRVDNGSTNHEIRQCLGHVDHAVVSDTWAAGKRVIFDRFLCTGGKIKQLSFLVVWVV